MKRECDVTPGGREAAGEEPGVRSPGVQPVGAVETIVSDMPPASAGSYLAVPTGSYWPVRQVSGQYGVLDR